MGRGVVAGWTQSVAVGVEDVACRTADEAERVAVEESAAEALALPTSAAAAANDAMLIGRTRRGAGGGAGVGGVALVAPSPGPEAMCGIGKTLAAAVAASARAVA